MQKSITGYFILMKVVVLRHIWCLKSCCDVQRGHQYHNKQSTWSRLGGGTGMTTSCAQLLGHPTTGCTEDSETSHVQRRPPPPVVTATLPTKAPGGCGLHGPVGGWMGEQVGGCMDGRLDGFPFQKYSHICVQPETLLLQLYPESRSQNGLRSKLESQN